MAEADREHWNARYAARSHATTRPSAAVVELERWLPSTGRALDVAGGAGRHGLWLAARGLDTTIVDISERGLALAQTLAGEHGVALHTVAADLECDPLPTGPWDVVLCSHYLQRDLLPRIAAELSSGGIVVWVHPTVTNLQRHPKPSARWLLSTGEAAALIESVGLTVMWSEEAWVGEGDAATHVARVVARRP